MLLSCRAGHRVPCVVKDTSPRMPIRPLNTLPWRLLKGVFVWTLALLILFEEWGWVPLSQLLAWCARWPVFAWLERRLLALPPRLALLAFFLPALGLLPVKLGALWLIAHHHALLGIGLILAAKLLGTAIVARLFTLLQPQLMQMAWFARLHGSWTAWKAVVMARVRASAVWRTGRALKAALRRAWRRRVAGA